MSYQFELHYRIKLETAMAIQSGSGSGRLNQSLMRDRSGLMIPATTQKGRLKFYCNRIINLMPEAEQTAFAERAAQLFGTAENRLDGRGHKRRNLLFFENAYLDEAFASERVATPTETRARIKINRLTGSVDASHLAFFETTPRNLVFDACIEGYLEEGKPGTDPSLGLLLTALGMFDRIGSNQSRGCGAVVCEPQRFKASCFGKDPINVDGSVLSAWREAFVELCLKPEVAS